MSLYLCLFENAREMDGVEVGPYADFNALRGYVAGQLEGGAPGSRFPVFMLHSDCDGEWSVDACVLLRSELDAITAETRARAAVAYPSEWQRSVADSLGLRAASAFESFLDVEGQPVLERIRTLVETALAARLPILFQ
jgi:hypothetical protein